MSSATSRVTLEISYFGTQKLEYLEKWREYQLSDLEGMHWDHQASRSWSDIKYANCISPMAGYQKLPGNVGGTFASQTATKDWVCHQMISTGPAGERWGGLVVSMALGTSANFREQNFFKLWNFSSMYPVGRLVSSSLNTVCIDSQFSINLPPHQWGTGRCGPSFHQGQASMPILEVHTFVPNQINMRIIHYKDKYNPNKFITLYSYRFIV